MKKFLIHFLLACPLLASASSLALAQATGAPTPQQLPPTPQQLRRQEQRQVEQAANQESSRLAEYLGYSVSSISLRNAKRKGQEDLLTSLPLQAGQPLERLNLRNSIEQLFATNRFRDVRAEGTPGPNHSIAVDFYVDEALFIGSLTLTGAPRPPSATQMLNASKLQLGDQFDEDGIQQAIERMKRLLAENGYFQSEVRMDSTVRPENQLIDLSFIVTRGARAHIGKVEVLGDPGFTPQRVGEIAHFTSGHTVTAQRVSNALNNLRKKYQSEDRLEAQVAITDRNYHPDTNTLDYTFTIDRGPRVQIDFKGASLRRGLIKRYVPVYEEHAVDDDLLNEGRRNIRDYLQTKGFFDATVAWTQDAPNADERLILYDVNRGKQHKLTDIIISGNKVFTDAELRERMTIQPADLLYRHGRFSQALLTNDINTLTAQYRAVGYQDVNITSEVHDDYKGTPGRIAIELHINEGPITLVRKLDIAGNKSFPSADLLNEISEVTPGQPYSDVKVATARDVITTYYFNRGFPDVQVEAAVAPVKDDPLRRDVTLNVTEGRQVFVADMVVTGLRYTKPFIVSREFELHPGDPISQSAILDTQRKLYDLTIFNQVDMAVQNPEGDTNKKDILMQMEEARRYTFNYGLGFEAQTGNINTDCTTQVTNPQGTHFCNPQGTTGFSPRVSFDVTRINFRGRNHTLLFKARVGRLEQRALIGYEQPHWLNRNDLTLNVNLLYDNTQDVLTFSSQRLEGSIQALQVLAQDASQRRVTESLIYRLSYRRVNVDQATLAVSPQLIPLLSQPVRVAIPSVSYVRDHRDDPIETFKGNYNTLDLGVASKIFGSESSFSRFFFQNSTYYPFAKRKWVFARSFRIGVEEPFGMVGNAPGFVPLPERFFSGGANSHRGFAINQAGPRDPQTGFPLGGEALLLNNLELRTPPLQLPYIGDNLSLVFFHDAGNVFTSAGDITSSIFRFEQPNRHNCRNLADNAPKCEFNYISQAIGSGIRYKTPIGPVRFDLGYNLTPPQFPVRLDVVKGPHVETVHRLNLFFSIGQTF